MLNLALGLAFDLNLAPILQSVRNAVTRRISNYKRTSVIPLPNLLLTYVSTAISKSREQMKGKRRSLKESKTTAGATFAYLGRCRWNPNTGGWVKRAALSTIWAAWLLVAATGCILSIAARRTAVRRGVGGNLTILSICKRRQMSRRRRRFNEGRFAKAYALNSSRATRSHPDSVGLLKN